jgi:hypothetical protein
MSDQKIARRELLRGSMTLGLLVLGGTAVAACGKKTPAALDCSDTTGMKPDEISNRTALQYVEKTTDPAKQCQNCQQFVAPPVPGTCGTCKVLKGNVNPGGNCKSWVAKSA